MANPNNPPPENVQDFNSAMEIWLQKSLANVQHKFHSMARNPGNQSVTHRQPSRSFLSCILRIRRADVLLLLLKSVAVAAVAPPVVVTAQRSKLLHHTCLSLASAMTWPNISWHRSCVRGKRQELAGFDLAHAGTWSFISVVSIQPYWLTVPYIG